MMIHPFWWSLSISEGGYDPRIMWSDSRLNTAETAQLPPELRIIFDSAYYQLCGAPHKR